MADVPFSALVQTEDGVLTIALSGDVDRDAEEALFSAWQEVRALAQGRVLLDFRDVSYINSTGIAVVVGLLARARADDRSLGVFGLSDHYRHVFEITRLIDFMDIYPDGEAARLATAASDSSH
jgi:anti-anti-sigma factor